MYPVSNTWETIMGNNEHWFESKVVVDGVTYSQDKIMSMTTSFREFSEEHPSVGACLSAELKLTMMRPTVDIPRMAKVEPYIRAREAYKGGDPQTKTGSIISFNNPTGRVQIDAMSTTLTPQQSGSGDPSPTNIRPITGWDNVTVTRTGKNLFDKSAIAAGKRLSTTTGLEETDSAYCVSDYIPVASGQPVFIPDSGSARRWFYDKNKTPTTYLSNSGNQAYTPSADGYIRITVAVSGSYAKDIDTYQVEYGTSSSSYAEYSGTSVVVDLDGTRYGGTLEVKTGVLTVTHGYATVSDLVTYSTWNTSQYSVNRGFTLASPTYSTTASTLRGSISNMGAEKTAYFGSNRAADSETAGFSPGAFALSTDGLRLRIYDPDTTLTEAQFLSKYASMTVCYELATPTTVQLTTAELSTLLGQNNVWANTSNLTMTYQDRALISEWIPQGKFFIDTREYTRNDDDLNLMTLHCYDSMLKTEGSYPDSNLVYPADSTDVVQLVANTIGVDVDDRTWELMQDYSYSISLPADYTMREVLSYIAAMFCGNFVMTYDGELLLVGLDSMPEETNYLVDNFGFCITFGGDRICV